MSIDKFNKAADKITDLSMEIFKLCAGSRKNVRDNIDYIEQYAYELGKAVEIAVGNQ